MGPYPCRRRRRSRGRPRQRRPPAVRPLLGEVPTFPDPCPAGPAAAPCAGRRRPLPTPAHEGCETWPPPAAPREPRLASRLAPPSLPPPLPRPTPPPSLLPRPRPPPRAASPEPRVLDARATRGKTGVLRAPTGGKDRTVTGVSRDRLTPTHPYL